MNFQSLLPVIGIIQNISQTPRDCCNQMITVSTPGGINQFMLTPNTVVVGSTPLRNEETVMLNFFRRDLTAADNSLRLNLNRSTEILTLNGQRYSCSPGGNFLLVYYTTTTRSIPPQTTPRRIIVLCSQT